MTCSLRFLIVLLSILMIAHRSPAPIQETSPLSKQEVARFAGTWTGRIKFGVNAGEVEYTLVINPEATSMIQKSLRFGENARPTTVNAGTLSWTAGPKTGNAWTLTPNPDGRTALVKVKPASGREGTATFQRIETSPKRNARGAGAKARP